MLKDNYSIKESKKTQKNRNAVILVVILLIITTIPQLILGLIFSSQSITRDNINAENLAKFISTDRFILALLYSTIFVSFCIYLLAKYYLKRNNASLGLNGPNKLKNYLKGTLLGLLAMTVVFFLLQIFDQIDVNSNYKNISPLIFLSFIVGWILQGFEEELLCRSVLMNYFAADNGVESAIIANSLIFSIMHISNAGFGALPFINIFLMGSIFSLLFYISDDIFLPAAAHSFWNFSQGNIYGINVSGISQSTSTLVKTDLTGYPLITGGAFGVEGGLITFFVEFVILMFLIYKVKNNENLYVDIDSKDRKVFESDL